MPSPGQQVYHDTRDECTAARSPSTPVLGAGSKLRVLSLFAGIGGFDLGLERTGGFQTVAFCEINDFCQRVLAKHWPKVPCYGDVCALTADTLARDGIEVDVIAGGFPCQDISEAGNGVGIDGERSGLWREYARLIRELRPSFVIVENVSALLGRGIDRVLGDLATLGYDAEWQSISAAAVGAPHIRERIWILAYPDSGWGRSDLTGGDDADRADAGRAQADRVSGAIRLAGCPRLVADAEKARREGQGCELPGRRPVLAGSFVPHDRQWEAEPELDRVANGIPHWSHRIASLGNAVVPQIPELIGRAILDTRRAA